MDFLHSLHLLYDGPAPAAERICARMGAAARFHAIAGQAEERCLESMVRRAARSMTLRRHGLAAADLQDEVRHFRSLALACRNRQALRPPR